MAKFEEDMRMLVALVLGAVLCVGDAVVDPAFPSQREASRRDAQLPHRSAVRWLRTPMQNLLPPFLTRRTPILSPARAATQIKERPHLPADVLKIRRASELRRNFEKIDLPPGSATVALEPDKTAVSGMLDNGLTYVILPNPSPPDRFEAHMEVMAGAADEEDRQQGMAHIVEHMTFLGSSKRDPLLGTGSKSNAFTDFHQTVFHVDCPLLRPNTNDTKMLPFALDMFRDILSSRFEAYRLAKEKAAVLSEMQMMNTIEYRLDCHLLEWLHKENRLSKRFPIGKQELIKDWDLAEVKRFHRTHYRPTNVMLYIIGAMDVKQTEDLVKKHLGTLPPEHEDYDKIVEQALQAQQKANVKVELGLGRVGQQLAEEPLGPRGERIEPSLKLQSMHFPPVLHRWTGGELDNSYTVPVSPVDLVSEVAGAVLRKDSNALSNVDRLSLSSILKDDEFMKTLLTDVLKDSVANAMHRVQKPRPEFQIETPYNVGIYHHQALQSFSFHIFSKWPIEPVNDMASLRVAIARRIAITALRVRLGVTARNSGNASAPQFYFIDFEMMDAPREGANVGSLDLSCDVSNWHEAIAVSVKEVRKFGLYGVNKVELRRHLEALISNSAQTAALGTQGAIPNSELMEQLKMSVACQHTWMDVQEAHKACEVTMAQITKEEVDREAYELTKHIVEFGKKKGEPHPSAIVCGVPSPYNLTTDMVLGAILDGVSRPVDPEPDIVVPPLLMTREMITKLNSEHPPAWADSGPIKDQYTNATARVLSNGIKVSYMPLPYEPNRTFIRLIAPGGRVCERGPSGRGVRTGAAAIGALALQEGGTFGNWSRQQLELFMLDNLIQGQIACTEDAISIDLSCQTIPVGNGAVSGMEAAFQIINRMLTPGGWLWEQDAFKRAKDLIAQQHDLQTTAVEGAATAALMKFTTNMDSRFATVPRHDIEKVTFDEAKAVTQSQLNPSYLDIAIVGDIDLAQTEKLILQYFGTVPKSDAERDAQSKALFMNDARAPAPAPAPPMPCDARQLKVVVEDSDARAVGYISGPAPNRWGVLSDGRHVAQAVAELAPPGQYSDLPSQAAAAAQNLERRGGGIFRTSARVDVPNRWASPLYGPVALAVLQEVISSRVFQLVRDRRQLSYDASFTFTSYERMNGSYWSTYVTATPAKADMALKACMEALKDLSKTGVSAFDLPAARRSVVRQHDSELRNPGYWASLLAGTGSDAWPLKRINDLKDFYTMADAVTAGDLMALIKVIGIGDDDKCYSCIGVSGNTDDEVGHSIPGVGHSRAKLAVAPPNGGQQIGKGIGEALASAANKLKEFFS